MEAVATLMLRRNSVLVRSCLIRRIMTTPQLRARVDEATEELKANPYYEKYAQKIAAMQKTSPEEFLSRIDARQEAKSKPKFGPSSAGRQYSSLLEPKKSLGLAKEIGEESLDKIMKVDLIKNKAAAEIQKIWEEYHKSKDVIVATLSTKSYEEMQNKAKMYPTFLFPIPRSQGYEFVVCQFYMNTVHFTPLLNYQVHKENAPECLTLTFYKEFLDKGIVLMRGEFNKNVLNAQEAQCLANQLQLYYNQNDPERLKLLDCFTNQPDDFKHMDLIKGIERLTIS